MLTIALNEYGDFHHLGQDEENIKTIHFIAGVVYDDMDNEQDAENERVRLDRFFRAVAEDSHSLYPQGIMGASLWPCHVSVIMRLRLRLRVRLEKLNIYNLL